MKKIRILNAQGELLDMELIFSFTCKETGKNYVALNNNDEIFEKNSRYANLDILEIIQEKTNSIYVSDIPDQEWDSVKHALQYNVFAKMQK
jgi:uncharacterized protein YrzB (UPF0473 family)